MRDKPPRFASGFTAEAVTLTLGEIMLKIGIVAIILLSVGVAGARGDGVTRWLKRQPR